MKKKIFKFKAEYAKLVEGMTDKQAGEFIKAVSGYAFFGKPLESKDDYLKGVYLYIQNELEMEARNSANGRLGAKKIAEQKRAAQNENTACMTRIIVGGDGMGEFFKEIFSSADDGEGSEGNILGKG